MTAGQYRERRAACVALLHEAFAAAKEGKTSDIRSALSAITSSLDDIAMHAHAQRARTVSAGVSRTDIAIEAYYAKQRRTA